MSSIVPFDFDGQAVRVALENGEPWFNAGDVCAALGYSNARDAVARHVDDEDVVKHDTLSSGGAQQANHVNESGLYALVFGSKLESAKRFKRWVTHDVLPTLRKTGSYGQQPPQAVDAMKLTPLVIRAARAHGLDKNAASISANQAVAKLTGVNVLELLGHTHLAAENQETLWYTPTELGKRMEVSARQFNLLLAEAGLQAKEGEHWKPLPAADSFYRLFDTGKRHGSGVPVQQIKWADNVLALIKPAKEAA